MGSVTRHLIELLIIQATPFCNINCSYCYLPNRSDRRRIAFDTLDVAFRRVFNSEFAHGIVTVLWHAGEPLAVPPTWYEQAFALAERWRPANLIVQHHFQTNGTLLDASWLGLLRRPDVRVGLSLDGPAEIHDARRRTRAGGGTFARTTRALQLLQEAGIPCHVITVLGRTALADADRMYEFYVANGITEVAFNIDEQDGIAGPSELSGAAARQEFRRFLRRFLYRLVEGEAPLRLREAWDMFDVIRAQGLHGRRAQDAEPMRILSIDTNGGVSSFSPELLGTKDARYGDFMFGNIVDDDVGTIYDRIVSSPMLIELEAGIARCARECSYFDYCGGGSPCNKLGETGELGTTETLFCQLMRQELLEAVLALVETKMPDQRRLETTSS